MFILNVHIAGWLLFLGIFLSIIFRNNFSATLLGISRDSFLNLLKNSYVALLSVILLAGFYIGGKYLPFESSPAFYRTINSKLVTSDLKNDGKFIKAFSFCGMGNIYRCRCEMFSLAKDHPRKTEIARYIDIIDKNIGEKQEKK